jgi:protein-L-isoaspartate O-methyltransferase
LTTCLHLPDDLARLVAGAAWRLGNLLDLRDAPAFAAGHLARSASLPLEPALAAAGLEVPAALASALPSIFLPPRHEALAVILERADLVTTVAQALAARGRAEVVPVVLPDGTVLPDAVRGVGPSSRVLWRPPDFLARWAHHLPPPAAGPVLDVACGSGRAAVWLAQRGYRVTGVDHLPEALDLARRLAASQGVQVDLVNADLRQPGAWPPGPWAVVTCFRYLQRDLLRALPARLSPGGVVMMRTFRHASGFVGSPQPQHRLAPGELLDLLPPPHFTPLVHIEDHDADGRPAAGIVAVMRAAIA